MTEIQREPVLHDLVTVVCAPAAVVSTPSGDLSGGPAEGYFEFDRKLLGRFGIRVNGDTPISVATTTVSSVELLFVSVPGETAYSLMEGPGIMVERRRTLIDGALNEVVSVTNFSDDEVQLELEMTLASDMAKVDDVRSGITAPLIPPSVVPGGAVTWKAEGFCLNARFTTAPSLYTTTDDLFTGVWNLTIATHASASVALVCSGAIEHEDDGLRLARPSHSVVQPFFPADEVADPIARRVAERSFDDLQSLLLADPRHPEDVFIAAGSPWYFTLFGRDSLWTARMLLPYSLELAKGTLRALSRYQGTKVDAHADEEPGKFPHEVRREPIEVYGFLSLPPVYYGGFDETTLWILLLHDAWRAGADSEFVRGLLGHVQSALGWLRDSADRDGDGLLEFAATTEKGLVNQCWKDSNTSLRWLDGSVVTGPVAPVEMQGYGYQAALGGAAILDAFGLPGAQEWREWAAELRERFRETFWIEDEYGRFPAQALDGDKRPVTGATSNIGHLLGTGLLDHGEAEAVAQRLMAEDLNCGYGLRVLSSNSLGYNPLSYHRGSVWPHDTAICIHGLLAEGYEGHARELAHGLIAAAERFDYRLPELYGAADRRRGEPVSAYPSSCTPQAWSAAAGLIAAGTLAHIPFFMALELSGAA